jgi:hypothetical protein
VARVGVTELHTLVPAEQTLLLNAYQHAIATTFLTSGVIAVAAVILSILVPDRELSAATPMPRLLDE